jgi:hypothetical protein
MKRLLVLTLAMALLVVPAGSSWSGPQRAETSWSSETEGSPVATINGQWSETTDGADRVDFEGPHVIGERTTFEARWLSPWVKWTGSRPVEIETEGGLEYLQDPESSFDLIEMVRVKQKGRRWGRWMRFSTPNEGNWGGVFWFSGTMLLSDGKPRPQRLRFEWRLVGEARAVSHLTGWAEVTLSR